MLKAKALVTSVLFCVCLRAQAQSTFATPPWLKWLGNGQHSYSCTSGTCNLTDELWFTTFSVSLGATLLNAGGNGPLIIRATGACTIAGSVLGGPSGGADGITGFGDFGGGGGGGGGGAAAGIIGRSTQVIQGQVIASGGAAGPANGGTGGSALSPTQAQYNTFLSNGGSWPGGGALGGQGGSAGGAGGQGGTPIIFVCNSISFTGTINASGENGGNSTANGKGAGGGGGGGYVVLAAKTFTANSGTIITTGGSGGSCEGHTQCGVGGTGGNGWTLTMTIK
jgi:hypothetical protein